MICGQCRLINPSDNLFCQNCGTTLEVPERLASPMFTKANTMDNNSILLTRNHWLVRWDLCLPFVLVAMIGAVLRWPVWGIAAVMAGMAVYNFMSYSSLHSQTPAKDKAPRAERTKDAHP